MNYIKRISAIAVLMLLFCTGVEAQNPVTINCETGNRSNDIASCWQFPGTTYTNKTVVDGNYSAITNQPASLNQLYGAISPWIKFNGSGVISWAMQLDGWNSGVKSRRFILLKEDASNQGTLDTLYTFDFNSSIATTIQTPSVNINFTGVYRIYFYFNGEAGNANGVFDDISITGDYYSSPSNNCNPVALIVDTDGDGVPDSEDAFPNDPTRAYVLTFPPTGPGTMMFEDTWPNTGDYDLNDLVVDYQIVASLNAKNNFVDMTFNLTTRAIGGFYHNGLMLQFDKLTPNYITSVKGSVTSGSSWVSLNANGTEAGQKYANILFYDDAYSVLPSPGGNFVNTIPANPYVTPVTTSIIVTFNATPGMEVNPDNLQMNPYIVIGQVRGNELHLVDNMPTSLADTKQFGTGADNTNLDKQVYYRTKNNLPFAISIDQQSIPYMQEQVDFTKGYPNIVKWAESNGASANDWYTDNAGNRNNSVLYIK